MAKPIEKILEEWENLLNNGYTLSIFKGYKAINKRGVEKLIHELYSTLETDIINAKTFLDSRDIIEQEKISDAINSKFNNAIKFAHLVIVNVKEIEELIKTLGN